MALLSQKQFIDIWTQLDALLGAVAGAPQNGGGVAAQWGDYADATPYSGTRNLSALTEAGGVFAQLASAAPGAPVGKMAAIANIGFIELGNAYVDYLAAGGAALTGIAKPREAGNPGQSYHDNILGNLRSLDAGDRFNPYTGGNINLGTYTYDPVANATTFGRTPEAIAMGATRPHFNGYTTDLQDRYNSLGWDLTVGGIDPTKLDLSPLQATGKYMIVNGTTSTVYDSLAAAVAAGASGSTLVSPSGAVTNMRMNDAAGTAGDDLLFATAGRDTVDGGLGNDTFSFSPASETGAFADLSTGFAFSGETGVDTLVNIENLIGTAGDDSFVGSDGDNIFYATAGTDEVDGGLGNDTFDSSGFAGNTTVDLGSGVASGYAGTAQTSLTSVENATTGAGNDTLIGTSGDNVLIGNGGNDTFTGNGGNDVIIGGTGFDTVNYSAVSADDFALSTSGGWSVDNGSGTDTLSGIEVVETGSAKILLVGNGGYASIQAAINAASDGDTILIAEGLYVGDLNITDKAISLVGVGEVEIRGQINVDDDMVDGDVLTFKNINIDATGKDYGIDARVDAVDVPGVNAGRIVLDNVSIENARQNGFFYTNSLNAANPVNNNTIGAIEIINNSSFHNNGYIHTGSGGRGHINLFGFNGDLTISDSEFSTETGRIDSNAVTGNPVNPHKAISVSGDRDGVNGVGPYEHGGNITLTNVTVTGDYATDVISFYDFAAFESFTLTDVNVTARGPWGLLNIDDVGGTVDTTGFTGTNTFAGRPVVAEVKGLATNDTLTGTDGSDIIIGRGGADVLDGGAGDDLIIGGSVGVGNVITDDANTTVDTAVFDGGELSWNGSAWIVTHGTEVDTLYGIERVTIGSDTYLLVDKAANGGFGTIQSAIDYASGGETILIAEGDYSESASYNPSNNTNTQPSNPVGLLINKSVTLQGVNAAGAITDADDVVATIRPSVQSNWGTQVFVTADNVSIIGLEIEALSTVVINKIVEIVADNFTLSASKVGAADGADIAASIYVNDRVATSDPGFVSAIETLNIDGNILEGDVVITNGAGLNRDNPQLNITNNEFVLNEGADDFYNWGIIITGQDSAVAWRLADVATPNVSGNTFTQGYTGDRILFVRGDNTTVLVDAADLAAFLSSNDTGTYAYVTAPNGELRYIPTGTTEGFAVHRFAGNASADALAGDTLVVSSGSNNDTQVITVDDLTVVASATSTQLNLLLDDGVTSVTLGDYAPGAGADVMVTGNAGDNVITGNSGNNVINGGAGSDDLSGGEGNDTFIYDSASDFGATESVDGGGNDAGIDSIVFRPGASETLELNSNVTGIEAVMIEANTGPSDNGINASVDASAVGSALAFFGDNGDNTFVGTSSVDSFSGGAGVDTVVENANLSVEFDTITNTWSVGGQVLEDIEIVDVNGAGGVRTLLVGNGGFATIQEAIAAAGAYDTILISEGTYNEKVVVNVEGLTLKAMGEVNIVGQLYSNLGIAESGSVAAFLATAASYSTNSGSGVTVSGSNITLEGLNIAGFNYGINLGEGTTNLTINGVDITDTISGINKATAADVNGVTINGGTITDSYQGIVFAKASNVNDGHATGLNINGLHFENLTEKGIYVETLTNSTFDGITMTNVGEYGRGPAFGGTGPNLNGFGAGIDINLKYGTYTGTIVIKNFEFNDVGSSNANGTGATHGGGAAITVKGRDDANSYNTIPANVAGLTVIIQDGSIDGTSTGIRLGEPGKANSSVNTTGPNLTVTNVQILDADFELDNVSKSVLTLNLSEDDTNAYDASNAATATGSIVFNGNALANTFTGAKGNDVFNGNGGADVFNGGDGDDTANFTSSADVALATFNGGAGTDTLAFNTSSETDIDLGGVTLNSVERVTIAGAAVNLDASDKSVGLTLVGSSAANTIIGTSGNDTIQGQAGNDMVKYALGQGSDSVDGGADFDTLEIDGKSAAAATTYALTAAGAVLTLTNAASATPATVDATQTITNVEKLKLELSNRGDTVTLSGDLAAAGISGAGSEVRIDAGSGNDVINAAGVTGAAKLVIELGDGDDTFIGGGLNHTVKGGAGLKDMIDFAQATGSINFNLGTGALMGAGIGGISAGNTGFEQVRGSAYNDILNGSTTATDETFYASLGNDLINGRGGADTYSGTYTRPDGVKESIGHALYVNLEDGFATDLATTALFTHGLQNIENLVGSAYDDWLVGDAGNNVIDGEAGDDILEGGLGDDTYIANSAGDVVIEEADGGIDTVITSRGRTTDLWDNVENLTLTAGTSAYGNDLDNVIRGNASNNIINGRAGADTMYGGAGNDTYYVDNVGDQVIETSAADGADIVMSTVSFTLGDFVENLTLTGSAAADATGNALDNIIRGNSGNNIITGGAGVDVLSGGAGNDVFVFNLGDTGMGANRDRINDFRHLQDDIDLRSMIDGEFTYRGESDSFGANNGLSKVRWFIEGNNTIVEGDVDGDGVGDFQIQLDGTNIGLTFSDFLL